LPPLFLALAIGFSVSALCSERWVSTGTKHMGLLTMCTGTHCVEVGKHNCGRNTQCWRDQKTLLLCKYSMVVGILAVSGMFIMYLPLLWCLPLVLHILLVITSSVAGCLFVLCLVLFSYSTGSLLGPNTNGLHQEWGAVFVIFSSLMTAGTCAFSLLSCAYHIAEQRRHVGDARESTNNLCNWKDLLLRKIQPFTDLCCSVS
jgi:hypothetical protein